MKTLLLNTYDAQGGAGIATYRIHKALRSAGVDSLMYVQNRSCSDYTVLGPSRWARIPAYFRPHLDSFPNKFFKNAKPELFSTSWVPDRLLDKINAIRPDLVHLFWINGGFARIETLGKIRQPAIWTMHDMWPFTGGCHYDDGCGKFSGLCGSCPSLYSSVENDISRRVIRRKLKSWVNWKVTVVATSQWLAKEARLSSVLCDKEIYVIPNAVDTDRYKPVPKNIARTIYNLPQDKMLIMFSAFAATSHPRKGGHLLVPALERIVRDSGKTEIELVIVGASQPEVPINFGVPVHYMGHFSDEISQAVLYSAADVLVAPSMQENLSNTVVEALSCGTPVVAFNIGGMPDMIAHKTNGYLAKAFSVEELAAGILWVLSDGDNLSRLSSEARKSAIQKYAFSIIGKKYYELYQRVLGSI